MQILQKLSAALRGSSGTAQTDIRTLMVVEELEPRILHSADPATALLGDIAAPQIEHRIIESSGEFASSVDQAQQTQSLEIVFVDPATPDYQLLIDDIQSNSQDGRHLEVVLLDAQADGITQISEYLATRQNISAVHIISHGSDGAVYLGQSVLDSSFIAQNEDQIAGWSSALTEDADILIYGCNVGQSDTGRDLLKQLSTVTSADVAASDDLTGHASLGGDWELEYHIGDIDNAITFTAQAWHGVLATFTVDTFNDTIDANIGDGFAVDASGNTSLRAAIMEANAFAGADTINLAAGTYTLTIAGTNENAAAQGDLDITSAITIQGAGAGTTIIDGAGNDRVFDVLSAATASISNVTIQGGNALGAGGGVSIDGGSDLTLSGVIVSGNTTGDVGGGIANNGSLTLTDTAISSNSATWGGGISNYDSMTLERVTIDANVSSNNGGGIYVFGANSTTLINTTISGNTSGLNGGAIWTNRSIDITNSTIAWNLGGRGIHAVGSGDADLTNTILANNTGGNANKALTSSGNNIDTDGTSGLPITLSSDLKLDPTLADNGGPTQTHALLTGSVAIDAGTASGAPVIDQRGVARDASPDIGAYEQISTVTLSTNTVAEMSADGTVIGLASVTGANIAADGQFLNAGTPVFFTTYNNGQTIGGWTVTQASVDVLGSNFDPSPLGGNSIDLAGGFPGLGGPGGAISQTLTTAAGLQYQVTFELSGAWFVDSNVKNVRVSFDGTSQDIAISMPAGWNSATDMMWAQQTLTFTAASSSTVLSFASLDGNGAGPIVADVSVAPVSTSYTYTLTDDAGGRFAINSSSGQVTVANGLLLDYETATSHNITVRASIGATPIVDSVLAIQVTNVNDAPSLTAPVSIAVTEDLASAITGISFSDVDAAGASVVATFTVAQGTLAATSGGGVTVGGSTTALTLTGSVANINAFISASNLSYTTVLNDTSAVNLAVSVNDQGNTGGGALSSPVSNITLNVSAINDAPMNIVPAAQNTATNTAVIFSTGNSNAISVSDVDAGSSSIEMTLSVSNGTLTLSGTSGLSFSVGSGIGNTSMTFSGTITNINAALQGLRYDPTLAFSGSDVVNVTTNDLGNSGSGGPRIVANTVVINVAFVNVAPVLSGANNLSAINEDQAINTGTSVSALIALQVSDADTGALSGIAVTAVDNTNGTWQYSVNGGGTWTSFGTPGPASARLLAADGNSFVRFVPNADFNGLISNGLTFHAWDQTNGAAGGTADTTSNGGATAFSTATASSSITVNAVNDTPTLTAPVSVAVTEDLASAITGISFADVDASVASVVATFTVAQGTLTATSGGGVVVGGSATALTLTGSIANINAFISTSNLSYTTALNDSSAVTLGASVNDLGNNGSGGALASAVSNVTLNVTAANDAPTLTAPVSIAVTEDLASPITGISFSDVDAAGASVVATFTVAQGTLVAVSGGGVTVGGSATVFTLTGSIANINAFISASNLTYTAALNDITAVNLAVSVNDQGNTGSGGALSSPVSNVTLTVSAAADTPSVTGALTNEDTQTSSGLVINRNGADGIEVTHFKITGITNGALFQNDGTTLINDGDFITFAEGNAGLKFTPTANYSGAASFDVQASTTGNNTDLSAIVSASITVSAVNDAPSAIAPASIGVTGDLASAIAGISFADVDAAAGSVTATFAVAQGTLAAVSGGGVVVGGSATNLTMTGSIANINAFISASNLTYTTVLNDASAVNLAVSVNDQGNTGGGALSSPVSNVTLNVSAVTTPPPAPPIVPPTLGGPPPAPEPPSSPEPPVIADTPSDPESSETLPAGSGGIPVTVDALFAPGNSDAVIATTSASTTQGVAADTQSGRAARLAPAGTGFDLRYFAFATAELSANIDLAFVTMPSFALPTFGAGFGAIQAPEFIDELNHLRDSLEEQSQSAGTIVTSGTVATLGLSVGYVMWLLRAEVLLGSLLSSMPAWRLVDPLPILGRLSEDDEDDESLESLVERENRTTRLTEIDTEFDANINIVSDAERGAEQV